MAAHIKFSQVSYTYPYSGEDRRTALQEISFELPPGEVLCVTGPNGSGKSTLAQLMAGLIKPTYGEVFIDGKRATRDLLEDFHSKVGLLFQSPEDQLFADTVWKDIAFGPRNQGLSSESVSRRVQGAAKLMGIDIEELGNRSPFGLSEGEKRRVALAGVLAMEPEVLILDEPTVGQDWENREHMLNSLSEYRAIHESSLVFISHDLDDALKLASRFLLLEEGRVRFTGKFSELIVSQRLLEKHRSFRPDFYISFPPYQTWYPCPGPPFRKSSPSFQDRGTE